MSIHTKLLSASQRQPSQIFSATSVSSSTKTRLLSQNSKTFRTWNVVPQSTQARADFDTVAFTSEDHLDSFETQESTLSVLERSALSNVSTHLARSVDFPGGRRQGGGKKGGKGAKGGKGSKKPAKKLDATKSEAPSLKNLRLKHKAYDLMQQFLFAAQEILWPLEDVLPKYHNQEAYRMAFLFGQLQLLVHEGAAIVAQEAKRRGFYYWNIKQPRPLTTTKRVQVYWSLVRRHIDASYLVDYLLGHISKQKRNITADPERLVMRVLAKEKADAERMLRQMRSQPPGGTVTLNQL